MWVNFGSYFVRAYAGTSEQAYWDVLTCLNDCFPAHRARRPFYIWPGLERDDKIISAHTFNARIQYMLAQGIDWAHVSLVPGLATRVSDPEQFPPMPPISPMLIHGGQRSVALAERENSSDSQRARRCRIDHDAPHGISPVSPLSPVSKTVSQYSQTHRGAHGGDRADVHPGKDDSPSTGSHATDNRASTREKRQYGAREDVTTQARAQDLDNGSTAVEGNTHEDILFSTQPHSTAPATGADIKLPGPQPGMDTAPVQDFTVVSSTTVTRMHDKTTKKRAASLPSPGDVWQYVEVTTEKRMRVALESFRYDTLSSRYHSRPIQVSSIRADTREWVCFSADDVSRTMQDLNLNTSLMDAAIALAAFPTHVHVLPAAGIGFLMDKLTRQPTSPVALRMFSVSKHVTCLLFVTVTRGRWICGELDVTSKANPRMRIYDSSGEGEQFRAKFQQGLSLLASLVAVEPESPFHGVNWTSVLMEYSRCVRHANLKDSGVFALFHLVRRAGGWPAYDDKVGDDPEHRRIFGSWLRMQVAEHFAYNVPLRLCRDLLAAFRPDAVLNFLPASPVRPSQSQS